MTAFLFISPTTAAEPGRRVDFANIASLFTEADEPTPPRRNAWAWRLGLAILILLGVVGDALLVSRPDALADSFLITPPAQALHRSVGS